MSNMTLHRPPQAASSRPPVGRILAVATGLFVAAGAVAACSSDSDTTGDTTGAAAGVQTALVEVHAAPGCGCCAGWEE